MMQLVKFGQSNIRENACSLENFIQAENVKCKMKSEKFLSRKYAEIGPHQW